MNIETVKYQNGASSGERIRNQTLQKPNVDIRETEAGIILAADLPGVATEGLNVMLENNVLSIEGHTAPPDAQGRASVYTEFGTNDFRRVFTLSDEVDREKITATLKNGVLQLFLPKVAEAKPRKIAVQSA